MKRFWWFVAISSLLAIPFLILNGLRKTRRAEVHRRYDINEYLADDEL